MKYSLISDMHVNHPQNKTPYDKLERLVVVAGDTSNGLEGLRFLEKLQNKGFQVLAIDGNHEHYSNLNKGRTIYETISRFRESFPADETIEGYRFIMRNGWYLVKDEEAWASYMNDMRFSGSSRDEINSFAEEDMKYIRSELQKAKIHRLKAVVVTHTAPCLDTLNPEFEGHFSNDWYYNPLMTHLLEEFSDTIAVWNHGHTHAAADKIVSGTRVVCNPRGYPRENPDWAPLTIELP